MTSKKDYVAVAKALKAASTGKLPTQDALRWVAIQLADYFREDNPAFDKERFLAACGFSQMVK